MSLQSLQSQFKFISPIKYFEIEEKGKKRFFIKGDFSNTEKDLVNDICTMNCIESMVKQLKTRSVKLDFEHETLRGDGNLEKEIAKTRIPLGKAIESNVRGNVAEAVWELNEGYKKFNSKGDVVMDIKDIKSNIEDEMLDAFSISYIPIKFSFKMMDGEQIRLLDEVRIITVALTGSAINTTSQIRKVFVKSLSALEEFERERKANPDIEDLIEVKNKSPQERRTRARKEAIAEDEEDDDEDEEKSYHGKKKKVKKSYEKDGAHAHTDLEPLGLHNHPEIENMVRFNSDMLNDRISFLSDRLFETVEDSSEPKIMAVKSKLLEGKSFDVSGGDKYFRDGKEIDPKTNKPYSPSLEGKPIKLEDQTMSDKDEANAQTPDAGKPEDGSKPDEDADASPEGSNKPKDTPAEGVEAKADSEIKSLKGQVEGLTSQVELLMKAAKLPVDGASVEDTNPKTEMKSNGPTRVLDLCY